MTNDRTKAAEAQAIDDAIRGIVGAMWGDDMNAYEEDEEGRQDLAVVLWALGYPSFTPEGD